MLNIAIILGPFAIENLSQSFNLKKTNKKIKIRKNNKKTNKQTKCWINGYNFLKNEVFH